VWFVLFLIFLVTGCAAPNGKGVLEIRIKDHEDAIGYFSKVDISIPNVRFSPTVGLRFWRLGWIEVSPSVAQLDLTKFVNNAGIAVFRGQIDASAFEAVDLRIREIRAILRQGSREVAIDNKVRPVALAFSVNPGELTTVVLDLTVMDMSDHPPATYELQLIGYEVYNNGKLVDKVPPG